MDEYDQHMTFSFSPQLREQFGESDALARKWQRKYPFIFDDDDMRLVKPKSRYHFFEWQAAILLYETEGYRSLIEKYGCANHRKKMEVLRRVCKPKLFEFLCDIENGSPDLFVYSFRRPSDFFFCEVKGPRDRIGDGQLRFLRQMRKFTDTPVRLLSFESYD